MALIMDAYADDTAETDIMLKHYPKVNQSKSCRLVPFSCVNWDNVHFVRLKRVAVAFALSRIIWYLIFDRFKSLRLA